MRRHTTQSPFLSRIACATIEAHVRRCHSPLLVTIGARDGSKGCFASRATGAMIHHADGPSVCRHRGTRKAAERHTVLAYAGTRSASFSISVKSSE